MPAVPGWDVHDPLRGMLDESIGAPNENERSNFATAPAKIDEKIYSWKRCPSHTIQFIFLVCYICSNFLVFICIIDYHTNVQTC